MRATYMMTRLDVRECSQTQREKITGCCVTAAQIVQAECQQRTASCSCDFRSEGREGRGSYTVQVDCSRKNLTELPNQLPNNTDELDVSFNQVTDQ